VADAKTRQTAPDEKISRHVSFLINNPVKVYWKLMVFYVSFKTTSKLPEMAIKT
jgi:hypothetical protein